MTAQEKRNQRFADCNIILFCLGFLGVLMLIGFAPLLIANLKTAQMVQIFGISILSAVICIAYVCNRHYMVEN